MKTIAALFLIALLTMNCFSQAKDTLNSRNSLEKGKWAVQFEVGNDFKLSSFDGVIISLKYSLSSKFAVRFGAGVNASNSDQTLDFKDYYYGYTGSESFNDNSKEVTFISNILFYPNPRSLLNIFFGIGPRASYLDRNDERIYIDGYKGYRKINSWALGLNGVFGCEWFPLKFLSLFGEYSVYGTYGKTTDEDYVREISTGEIVEYYYLYSDNFQFRGNIARLGLSLYF
ncbi:MAG TPA: hypothetical protein VGK25_01835 [Ignavibacteria bacterium]|jgi:hypothetical protein